MSFTKVLVHIWTNIAVIFYLYTIEEASFTFIDLARYLLFVYGM